MNTHPTQHTTFGAQLKRTGPVPRIVKAGQSAAGAQAVPTKPDPTLPLKPANVMKAVQAHKHHSPWLTTAKIPRTAKIP